MYSLAVAAPRPPCNDNLDTGRMARLRLKRRKGCGAMFSRLRCRLFTWTNFRYSTFGHHGKARGWFLGV